MSTKGRDTSWYTIRGLRVPTEEDYIRDERLKYAPPIGMVKIIPIPKPSPTHVPHLPVNQRELPPEEQESIRQQHEEIERKQKDCKRRASLLSKEYSDWKIEQQRSGMRHEVSSYLLHVKQEWMRKHPLSEYQDGAWHPEALRYMPQPYMGRRDNQYTCQYRKHVDGDAVE